MITIEVTPRQAQAVMDVIDNWTESADEVVRNIEQDRTLDKVEDMLTLIADQHTNYDDLVTVRMALFEQLDSVEGGNH